MDISNITEITNVLSSISGEVLQMYISKIMSIAAVPILILGIINCFFGYKIFRIVVTIGGTMLGGIIGMLIGGRLDSVIWLLAAVVICAAAGAFAAYKLYMAGAFIMGFFTGMMVGAVAMVVLQKDAVLVAAVLAGLILGLLAVDLYKYVLVALTSINGGILIGMGINVILKKDSPELILLSGLAAAFMGMVVQYAYVFTHSGEKVNSSKKKKAKTHTEIKEKKADLEPDIEKAVKVTDTVKKQKDINSKRIYREEAEINSGLIPDIVFDNAANLMFVYVIISLLCDMIQSQNVLGQTLVNYPVILFAAAMINILKKDYKMAVAGFSMFEIAAVIYFLGSMDNAGLVSVMVVLAEIVCVGMIIVYIFKRFISNEEHIEPDYDFGYEEDEETEYIDEVYEDEEDEEESLFTDFKEKIYGLKKHTEDFEDASLTDMDIEIMEFSENEEQQEDMQVNTEEEFDISDRIMQQTKKAMKYDEFTKL